jgi:hypothetical protein
VGRRMGAAAEAVREPVRLGPRNSGRDDGGLVRGDRYGVDWGAHLGGVEVGRVAGRPSWRWVPAALARIRLVSTIDRVVVTKRQEAWRHEAVRGA